MFNHSFMPIGALPAAWMADILGAPAVMAIMGLALVLAVVGMAVAHPSAVAFRVPVAQDQSAVPSR
jgi:ABC-type phosphate transport system auxiliary subunit